MLVVKKPVGQNRSLNGSVKMHVKNIYLQFSHENVKFSIFIISV